MTHDYHSFKLEADESQHAKPPQWVHRLANLISRAFRSADVLAPIGCHFHQDDQGDSAEAEVTLFVSSTELYGGACDGQITNSRFMLDLRDVLNAFDAIESFYWQAQKMADDDQVGPHIGLEGVFEGRQVWLRIAAEPPAQFESGRVANLCTKEFEERW